MGGYHPIRVILRPLHPLARSLSLIAVDVRMAYDVDEGPLWQIECARKGFASGSGPCGRWFRASHPSAALNGDRPWVYEVAANRYPKIEMEGPTEQIKLRSGSAIQMDQVLMYARRAAQGVQRT